MFLVRKGNPKAIKDWDDLAQAGRRGDHAEPEDLGRRALELPGGLGLRARRSPAATRPRRKRLRRRSCSRTCRCSTPARAARRRPSSQRGIGDVLIAWENEALPGAATSSAPDKFEIVVPSLSILAEPPVAVVDKVVDKHGTRKVAEAYLEFLYSPEGQEIVAKHYYRPRRAGASRPSTPRASRRSSCSPSTRSSAAGRRRRATHFADGGMFDQIYKPEQAVTMAAALALRSASTQPSVLPGFGLTLGFTLIYLSPDRADPARRRCSCTTATLSWAEFWHVAHRRRACWRPSAVSFGAAFAAASINAVFGAARRLGAGALRLSRAGASSTRWSTCRSRCRPRSPASR